MLFKFSLVYLLVLVAFVAATPCQPPKPPSSPTPTHTQSGHGPTPTPPPPTVDQCSNGVVNCCKTVTQSKEAAALLSQGGGLLGGGVLGGLGGLLGGLLGPVIAKLQAIDLPVGLDCVLAGATCTQQKVCCQNNEFKGLIAIGCTPITVAL